VSFHVKPSLSRSFGAQTTKKSQIMGVFYFICVATFALVVLAQPGSLVKLDFDSDEQLNIGLIESDDEYSSVGPGSFCLDNACSGIFREEKLDVPPKSTNPRHSGVVRRVLRCDSKKCNVIVVPDGKYQLGYVVRRFRRDDPVVIDLCEELDLDCGAKNDHGDSHIVVKTEKSRSPGDSHSHHSRSESSRKRSPSRSASPPSQYAVRDGDGSSRSRRSRSPLKHTDNDGKKEFQKILKSGAAVAVKSDSLSPVAEIDEEFNRVTLAEFKNQFQPKGGVRQQGVVIIFIPL